MPDPVIDSKNLTAACEQLDSRALVSLADHPEHAPGSEPISLTRLATEISDALKQSGALNTRALEPIMELFQHGALHHQDEWGHGIALHRSVLMELLDTESTAANRNPEHVREEDVPSPVTPKIETSAPVQPAIAEKSPVSTAPPPSVAAPAQASGEASNTVPPASPLPMSVVIDNAVRALSILKLRLSSVISVARVEDGWKVAMELVERAGVPDTSDVLGVYELRLDAAANVLAYERTRMRRRCDLGR